MNQAAVNPLVEAYSAMGNVRHKTMLIAAKLERHEFDATKRADRIVYYVYLKTGRWIKHYNFKAPDLNVVMMVQRKLIDYALRKEIADAEAVIKNLEERTNVIRITEASEME
jgi:hypothetical protein